MGKRIVGLVLQALLGWWLWTPAALAATINVTTTADVIANNGQCSLREAIINANNNNQSGSTDCTAGLGADTIVLVAGQTYTLSLDGDGSGHATDSGTDNDDLDIVAGSTVTIAGNGATIERSGMSGCDLDGSSEAGEFRIFEVVGTGNLTLHNVTIRNGCADGSGFHDDGGGIRNAGTVTVTSSDLSDNRAIFSGAIHNAAGGTVTVTQSRVSDNLANSEGGGIGNASGGTVTVTNSAVRRNDSPVGGGILNAGTATVTGSNVLDNQATDGGGIWNNGTVTVTNSTVSGNNAVNGGGIWSSGTTDLSFTTIASNSATAGGGIYVTAATVKVKNSIVGNHISGGNCSVVAGTLVPSAVNFSTDGTCTGFTQVSSAALNLGPLANNGGPTQTHALLSGSVAIDAVPAGQCTDLSSNPVTEDQRGVGRPEGKLCDAGAYEARLVGVPAVGTLTTGVLAMLLGALGYGLCRLRRPTAVR